MPLVNSIRAMFGRPPLPEVPLSESSDTFQDLGIEAPDLRFPGSAAQIRRGKEALARILA